MFKPNVDTPEDTVTTQKTIQYCLHDILQLWMSSCLGIKNAVRNWFVNCRSQILIHCPQPSNEGCYPFCRKSLKNECHFSDKMSNKNCERHSLNNNRALELETAYHYRPNVKHIAAKYHHFSEHITKRTVSIEPIDTKEQIEDQLIKEPTG